MAQGWLIGDRSIGVVGDHIANNAIQYRLPWPSIRRGQEYLTAVAVTSPCYSTAPLHALMHYTNTSAAVVSLSASPQPYPYPAIADGSAIGSVGWVSMVGTGSCLGLFSHWQCEQCFPGFSLQDMSAPLLSFRHRNRGGFVADECTVPGSSREAPSRERGTERSDCGGSVPRRDQRGVSPSHPRVRGSNGTL